MISQLLGNKKEFHFERSYRAPVDAVWRPWTDGVSGMRWGYKSQFDALEKHLAGRKDPAL